MGDNVPILFVKDGQTLFGKKGGTDIECFYYIVDDYVKFYNIRTPKGQAICYDIHTNYPITSIEIKGNLEPMQYIGDLITEEQDKLYPVFISQDKKKCIGIIDNEITVRFFWLTHTQYLGYDIYAKQNGVRPYAIVGNYLIYSNNYNSYLFKDLQLLCNWYPISTAFLNDILQEGIKLNKMDEYIETINKLVGLSKLRNKIGKYRIRNILYGITKIKYDLIKELLNDDNLIMDVIGNTTKVYRQIRFALSQVGAVEPLITDPKHLKEVPNICIIIYPNVVHIKLNDCTIIKFDEKITEPYFANLERWKRPLTDIRFFLYDFCRANSLSTTLSQKQILLWARLLKNLDISKQVIQTNENI